MLSTKEKEAENLFRTTFTIASWDLGPGGRPSPHALLRYLEETAWRHAESGNYDDGDLGRHGLFWGLVRQKVRLGTPLARGEKITVTTWHAGHDRIYYYRCFRITDSAGSNAAEAVTAWVMVDAKTRRMVRPSAAPVRVPEGDLGELAPLLPKALPSISTDFPGDSVTAGFRDLDRNSHVNNVRYPEWFFESVPEAVLFSSRLSLLEVEYRSEVRYGETLSRVMIPGEDGSFEHGLFREGGKPVCRARSLWTPHPDS